MTNNNQTESQTVRENKDPKPQRALSEDGVRELISFFQSAKEMGSGSKGIGVVQGNGSDPLKCDYLHPKGDQPFNSPLRSSIEGGLAVRGIDPICLLEGPSHPLPKGGVGSKFCSLFFLAINEGEDIFAYSSGTVPIFCTTL